MQGGTGVMDLLSNSCFNCDEQSKDASSNGSNDDMPSNSEDKKANDVECISLDDNASNDDELICDIEFITCTAVDKNAGLKAEKTFNSPCEASKSRPKKWQEIEPDSDEEVGNSLLFPEFHSSVAKAKCKAEGADRKSPDKADKVNNSSATVAEAKSSPDSVCLLDADSSSEKSNSPLPLPPGPAPPLDMPPRGDSGSKGEAEGTGEGGDEEGDSDSDSDEGSGTNRADRIKEMKKNLAVSKLSYLVEKLNKKIKSLEEQELSFDDMKGESVYTQLELYKKKLIMAWKKLMELKSLPATTGRDTEKPFLFRGTNYPQINKAISKFVNRYQTFPDYQDVHEIVLTCNDFFKLKLNKQMVSAISLSAFTNVGKALKNRRIRDYKENAGSHLTDQTGQERDPAEDNMELRKKLEENRRKAESNVEKSMPARNDDEESDSEVDDDDDDDDNEEEDGNGISREGRGREVESPKRKKESSPSSASEAEVTSGDEEEDDEKINEKKSLSVRYDAERLHSQSSETSRTGGTKKSPSPCRPTHQRRRRSLSGSCSSTTTPSARSLRSNRGGGKPGPRPEVTSAPRQEVKRASKIGPKSARKRQRVDVEEARNSIHPTFVRLVDEIRKPVDHGGGAEPRPDLVSMALMPSRVVLTNCMNCRVICRKSIAKMPSSPSRAADVPPTVVPRKPPTARRTKRPGSGCSSSPKKVARSKSIDSDRGHGKDEVKAEPESQVSTIEVPTEEQSEKSECQDGSQEDSQGPEDSPIFGNVVGEVLTYQGYEDDCASREDESLVESVSSLGKGERTAPARPDPAPVEGRDAIGTGAEVVNLVESESRNEDGVIFVGTYTATASPTGSTPRAKDGDPESAEANPSSSSFSHAHKIILGQRRGPFKAANWARARCRDPSSGGRPTVANGPLIPLGHIGAYSGSGRYAAKFLEPTPLGDVELPKLPAKVMRQINNMARRLTSSALRGRGRGGNTGCFEPRDRGKPFLKKAAGFTAGRAYASAMANFSNGPRKARRGPGASGGGSREHADFIPDRPSTFYRDRNYARPPLRGTSSGVPCQRKRGGGGGNQPPFMMETVIIDDDDSLPQLDSNHLLLVDPSTANCSQMPNGSPETVHRARNLSPNSSHRFDFLSAPLGRSVQSNQPRKLQQKTKSNDSDVILCGIEYDQETFWEGELSVTGSTEEQPGANHGPAGGAPDGRGTSAPTPEGGSAGLKSQTRSLRIKTISDDSDVILCEDGVEINSADGSSRPPLPPTGRVDHPGSPFDPESAIREIVDQLSPGFGSASECALPSSDCNDQSDAVTLLDSVILLD